MNRHHRRSVIYLTLILLIGVTLACDIGSPGADDDISPATEAAKTDQPSPVPKATPTQPEAPPTASSPSTVQVYYVAANEPGASDDNNGLYSTYQGGQDGPWLTIQHAANTMTAGGTTYVRAGTYYESGIIFAHSGTAGAPITLSNYESEEVIIDGSKAQDDYPGIAMVDWHLPYYYRGLIYKELGQTEAASADFRTLWENAPDEEWQRKAEEELEALQ